MNPWGKGQADSSIRWGAKAWRLAAVASEEKLLAAIDILQMYLAKNQESTEKKSRLRSTSHTPSSETQLDDGRRRISRRAKAKVFFNGLATLSEMDPKFF